MPKILIVDDEPRPASPLAGPRGHAGHVVVPAASGPEALRICDDDVDAVITDLSMPGMDGLELLAALRQRDAALPVLLLTARGSERIAVQALKAGAYDYLIKPFDIDEIVLAVARAAEAPGLRRDPRRLRAHGGLRAPVVGGGPGPSGLGQGRGMPRGR